MEGVVLLGIFWAAVYLGNKIDKLDKKQEELFIIMAKNHQKIWDAIAEVHKKATQIEIDIDNHNWN